MILLLASTILGIFVATASGIVISAGWHDARAITRQRRLAHITRTLRRANQPHVALLIYAGDSPTLLEQSLRASIKCRYRHLTLCVANSHSNPRIIRIVQTYRYRYPQLPLFLYTPRRPVSQADCLRRAYRQRLKHDFVFTLQAGDSIRPGAIKQAVARFNDDWRLGVLHASRRCLASYSLTSLVIHYSEISNQLIRKAWPGIPYRIPPGVHVGTLQRHSYFMMQRNVPTRQRYDASLVITHPQTLFPIDVSIFTWLLIVALAFLFVVTSVAAATLQSSTLLTLLWLSLCFWLLAATWSETRSSPQQKITLSYGLLSAPLLIFISAAWLTVTLPTRALCRLVRQRYRTRRYTYRYRYERYVLDNILTLKAWYERVWPRETWYQD